MIAKSTTRKPTRRNPKLTPEQAARLRAFEAFARHQQEQWDGMSPAEREAEVTAWRNAMKRMNDDRKGYRQIFKDGRIP